MRGGTHVGGDTIAAIATAAGGGVGIIRVSGPEAISLLETCFRPSRVAHPGPEDGTTRLLATATFPAGLMRHGWLMDGEVVLDEGLAVAFRGPRSLTGEDVVELHLHGGARHLASCLEALLRAGAASPGPVRLARPGEFLQRAFLAGKLDLTRAEAIADLIAAQTDRALAMARRHLTGALAATIGGLRERLLMAAAELEAHIDFVEEGLPHLDVPAFCARLAVLSGELGALLATSRLGTALREGARVALVGPPNAGKSSLFNALVGADRAIVSPLPGTTRDTLREGATIGGIPVLLCDTAGLRATDDPIEALGVARTRATAAEADVMIEVVAWDEAQACWPAEALPEADLAPGVPRVRAFTKADLAGGVEAPAAGFAPGSTVTPPGPRTAGGHKVSARTGEGLEELAQAVVQALGAVGEEDLVIGRARHREALAQAAEAIGRARSQLAGDPQALTLELPAFELHEALAALGAIIGETGIEDVLDRLFSTFCIGK
jgi:tRNA modification GTPase